MSLAGDIPELDELQEDAYDRMLIDQRKREDTAAWNTVKEELQHLGKLDES